MYLRKITTTLLLCLAFVTANAHFIFRISGGDLEKPSYILGTVHLMSGKVLDSIPAFLEAEAQCRQLYVEYDVTDKQGMQDLQEQGKQMTALPDSITILDVLGKEKSEVLNEKMQEAFKLNLNDSTSKALLHFQPVIYTNMLIMSATIELLKKYPTLKPNDIMDAVCVTRARSREWNIGQLDQFILDKDSLQKRQQTLSLSIEAQVDSLMSFLDRWDTWKATTEKDFEQAERIQEYWRQGDYKGFEEFSVPEIIKNKELFEQRNRKWLSTMTEAMHTAPTLFAFGAGHLVGNDGIVSMLRRAGYKVEQVGVSQDNE